jgi:hypothetical protein
MKCIIAGGREVPIDRASKLIFQAIQDSGWAGEITEIVHGGASGIDAAAHVVASGTWPIKVFKANWSKLGRSAGPVRNAEMANYASALIAIWDGKSRGTASMIRIAESAGLKVFVLNYE